jgi:hypothetical protein
MAEWQLRDYTIQDGHFDDFLAAWTAGVLPLRRRFGFEIQAWSVPEDSHFVWIVRYDGPGTFEEADRAYYASPERAAVHPNPSPWIAEQRVAWLTPVTTEGERT